jgi:periplasmic divalent cation tolerance protein
MSDFLQVSTACGTGGDAEHIALALVESRLAACVQVVGPVQSVYRWQGAVERAEEWLCHAKTARSHYSAVEALIRKLHPYECPEIIATPIVAGGERYLDWLGEQLASDCAERPKP